MLHLHYAFRIYLCEHPNVTPGIFFITSRFPVQFSLKFVLQKIPKFNLPLQAQIYSVIHWMLIQSGDRPTHPDTIAVTESCDLSSRSSDRKRKCKCRNAVSRKWSPALRWKEKWSLKEPLKSIECWRWRQKSELSLFFLQLSSELDIGVGNKIHREKWRKLLFFGRLYRTCTEKGPRFLLKVFNC